MKKLLTVSVLAIMAVSTANAEIASTGFVTDRTGTLQFTGKAQGETNLTAAVNAIATAVGDTDVEAQINNAIKNATIEQDQVSGLDVALAGKADSATTLSGYGITDAYTKTEVDGKVANMEVTTNRTSNITQSLNDGDKTAYPTVDAVKNYLDDRFTSNEYSGEEGIEVDNLDHTINLIDNAVTSAKLAPAVRDEIAKGVAADTLSQQNKAAIEALDSTYAKDTDVSATYETKTDATAKLVEAKSYADKADADAVAAAKAETTTQVNALANGAVKANTDAIAGMDATYAAQEGKYIASVTQADGKVTATYADLTDVAKMEVPEVCNGTATCALVWNKNTKTLDWEAIMQ